MSDGDVLPAPELPGAEIALEGAERPEWLSEKMTGVGASEIAAILGIVGSYGSKVSIWQSKFDPSFSKPDTPNMRAGRLFEQAIAQWFTEETGIVTFQPTPITLYRSREQPLFLASPDRLAQIPGAIAWLEVKNAGGYQRKEWEHGPPLPYLAQCQWQLLVSRCPLCYLVVCLGGNDFRYYVVEPDWDWQDRMAAAALEFWQLVEAGTPPEVDDTAHTTEALLAHYPAPVVGSKIEGGEELRRLVLAYREASERASVAEADKRLAKNQMIALLGEHEVGTIDGKPAVTFKMIERGGYVVEPTKYRSCIPVRSWKG